MKLFSCRGSEHYAQRLAAELGVPMAASETVTFVNGELRSTIKESVREEEAVIVCQVDNLETNINDAIMECCLLADASRRAGARGITVLLPLLPYARQDKLFDRESLGAKVIARMLEASGVDRVLSCDVHATQLTGFYEHLIDLDTKPLFTKTVPRPDVVVSPDAGGAKRSERYAKMYKTPLALMHKNRDYSAENRVTDSVLLGEVESQQCLLVDDMIDTAGTVSKAITELHEHGAKTVTLVSTHGLFNGPAIDRLNKLYEESILKQVFITDTVVCEELPAYVTVVSSVPLFAQALDNLRNGKSIRKLIR